MHERDDSDDGDENDNSVNENNDSSFCMQMDFSCTVFVRDCIKIISPDESSREEIKSGISVETLFLSSGCFKILRPSPK